MTGPGKQPVRAITFVASLLGAAAVAVPTRPAHAIVQGTTPGPFESYQVFGDGVAIGNTLMANPPPTLNVNTVLLPSSSANLMGIPSDANPQAVYLWWSGSLAPGEGMSAIDDDVVFTAADGATTTVFADGPCRFLTTFPGASPLSFYYCRADVTAFVTAHPGMFSFNGTYTVGDVYADPGHVSGMSCASFDLRCQAKYAAWTMIFVYDSPSASLQRDVIIYDGFVHCDETEFSLGITNFTIGGFLVGTPPEAELTYFGMEGDAHLGAGPGGHCATCPDFFNVNSIGLSDGFNPVGNVYNSSDALGVDIDEFNIGSAGGGLGILDTGDTSASISTGTGDSILNPGDTGESIFLGWVFLRLNRPSPNFRGPSTHKVADRASAATGETITYSINVANQGSLAATNTTFSDTIPSGMTYQPGSMRIDGVGCTDAADADGCTFSGGTITINLGTVNFSGDNDRLITFRTTMTATGVGTSICNVGTVTSTETPTAAEVGPACTTVATASLGQPTKTGVDLTGGVTGPDDVYQYTIAIPGDPGAPTSGISFTDDMPAHVQLLSYTGPGGTAVDESSLTGGANGNGRVRFTNISIATGGTATITITVQVDSEAEFVADGIPAASIHGTTSCNQGAVAAGFLPSDLPTDNPATSAPQDSTCFTVTYAPIFSLSSKGAVDDDGGILEPGDTITYTISLTNSGNRTGTVSIDDSMPAEVENFTLLTPLIGATFTPPPAGTNGTGRFQFSGLAVSPGSTATIQFRVTVKAAAVDGTTVVNVAAMSIAERSEENRDLTSPSMVIVSRPDLTGLTKAVTDVDGGSVEPGDTLSYSFSVTNTGNRPATSLVLTDPLPAELTAIAVTGGPGVYDPGTHAITWTLATLDVGDTFTASFTADVISPLANGTQIANQATIDSSEPAPAAVSDDPSTALVDDPTIVTVTSAPNLSAATKTVVDVNGAPARPGDTLEWTLAISNGGSEIASDVVVTDAIDPNLTNVVPLDGGVLAAGSITWSLGALAPGESRTVRFRSDVVTPLLDGTVISNQGSITTPELAAAALTDDPSTPAIDDPTSVTVESSADFALSTISFEDLNGGAQQPGDSIRYTVTIVNSGDSPATSIVAQVLVDLRFATVTPESGGTFDATTRLVTWNLAGPLDPGDPPLEVSFVATIVEPLPDGEVICEAAVIDSPQSSPFTTESVCFTVDSRPDFAATTKTVVDQNGGSVRPGDVLVWTITVRNEGNEDGANVVVTDVVDANLTAVTPLDGGVFDAVTRTITWTLPLVGAGAAVDVRFNATVVTPLDDGTEIENQASVTCGNGCPAAELSDDPATPDPDDPTRVVVVAQTGLAIAKTFVDDDGGILDPGDAITYTLALSNSGDSCADDVIVTDVIDVNLGGVAPDSGGVFDAPTRTVTWNAATTPALARVCPGAPVNLVVRATVASPLADGTPICNQGQAVSDEQTTPVVSDDPSTPTPNDQTCRNVVSGALVTGATKTVVDQNGGDVRPGDTLVYTIAFTNEGNANAIDVTVTDPIDPSFATVVASGGGAIAAGTITWSSATTPALAVLEVGETVTFTVTATLATPLPNGTIVDNQATISAEQGITIPAVTDDPATPVVDDATSVTITSAAIVTAEKTFVDEDGGVHAPGDVFLYTLTFTNSGDATAALIQITDTLDPNLTFVEALDGGAFNAATQTITWTIANLQPGAPVARRFRAAADTPLPDGTQIPNQGTYTVEGDPEILVTDDPTTPAPSDPTIVVIVAAPDLSSSTKSVSGAGPGGVVTPGTILTYTISVVNSGDAVASGVVVTDPIDTAHLDNITPLDGGVYNGATGVMTWNLGQVFPGIPETVRFTARVRFDVQDGITIENQAGVTSIETPTAEPTDDPLDPEPDDPTEVVTDATPALAITKSVEDQNGLPVAPGDLLAYTIIVDVAGPAHAFDVVVTDPISSFLGDVVPQNGGVLAGGQITWNATTTPALAHVAPGTPVTLGFTARVADGTPDGTLVANQASVLADGLAVATPSDNPATPVAGDPTTVVVVARPILDVQKTVVDDNGGHVSPGDVLTYTIAIVNEGTAPATEARLFDAVPPQTAYVPGSTRVNGAQIPDAPGGAAPLAQPPSGVLLATVLDVGNTATASFQVRVNADALVGTILSNQGLASTIEIGTVPSDDPTTATPGDATQVIVGGGPLLTSVTKTFDPTPLGDDGDGLFEPGELIQYRVTIQNTGDAVAPRVRFTDPLPAGAEWVAGSLRLNGQTITDPIDGDAGEFASGAIRVRVGDLAPDQTATIEFRVRVLTGVTQISNQGTVDSDATPPEPTDADGNDGNGDQPTVTQIGDAPSLSLVKSVIDIDGGTVDAGDELLYTLSVTNVGTTRVVDMTLQDDIPGNVTYVAGSTQWPGAPADPFEPGTTGKGGLTMPGLGLDAGETLIVTYRVTIDSGNDGAEPGDDVCNSFDATVNLRSISAEAICVVVGSYPGAGRFEGRAYIEGKAKDRVFTEEDDEPYKNLTLQFFRADDPRGQPIAGLFTGDDGRYALNAVPPGEYVIRAFTSRGAQLAMIGHVVSVGGRITEQDVWIDPSGRVYESTTARYVQDVRVFLHYDEEDPREPGRLVPPERLGPGQQGQMTPAEGVYRFDVADLGRKYRLSVEAGPTPWSFPSQIIPPTPGFAPPGNVVDDPSPSLDPNAVRTYYLRFDLAEPGDDVFNNHVPLDPLSAQIRLDKRSDRPDATVGDIVNYTITVKNQSNRDFTAAEGEPVFVVDVPARGLSYARGQAAAQVRRGSTIERLIVGSGFQEEISALSSAARVKWGPFDLPAGATLLLHYQVVVGLDTRKGTYTNRAVLVGDAERELSNSDSVDLRVKNDPIFDEGVAVGRVFCDVDGDGRAGKGDRGVYGARIYIDTGSYVRTDEDGKWHLSAIDPGMHLIKLDVATLPAGATLVGDDSRTIYFTRGLGARAMFPVKCVDNAITLEEPEGSIKLSGKTRGLERPEPPKPPKTSTTITGDLATLAVAADGTAVLMPRAELHFVADPSLLLPIAEGSAQNLVAPGETGWKPPPVFRASFTGEDAPQSWSISVWRVEPTGEKTLVRTLRGQGAPADVPWDGKGDDDKIVARDAVYVAQLAVAAERSVAASARLSFGIAYGLPDAPARDEVLRGDFFAGTEKKPKPKKPLRAQVTALAKRIGPEDTIVVEVHADGTGERLKTIARTQRQADLVRELLIKESIAPDRIKARGRGSLDPIVAAPKTKKDKAQNRRVVVKVTPPPPKNAGAPVPAPAPGSDDVLVLGQAATIDANGRFVKNVDTPADGKILVDVVAADGRRSSRVIEVPPPPGAKPATKSEPVEFPLQFMGDVATGALTLGGNPLDTSLLSVDVGIQGSPRSGEPNYTIKTPKRKRKRGQPPPKPALDRDVVFETVIPPTVDAARWELVVRVDGAAPDAAPLWKQEGFGPPPPTLGWNGGDPSGTMILKTGSRYRYRLFVEDARGNRVETPWRVFTVGVGAKGAFKPLAAAGALFNKKGDPGAVLKNRAAQLKTALKKRPPTETYRIELRVKPAKDALANEIRLAIATRVGKLKNYLTKLGVPLDRVEIVAEAVPPDAPKKEQKDSVKIVAVPATTLVPARVILDGEELPVTGDTFAISATLRDEPVMILDVTVQSGHRAIWVFTRDQLQQLLAPPPAPSAPPAPPAAPPLDGGVPDAGPLSSTDWDAGRATPVMTLDWDAKSTDAGPPIAVTLGTPPEADNLMSPTDKPVAAAEGREPLPVLTLSLADDPDEFGGEELENALADPESLAQPRGARAGRNMGRLISQAGTNVKLEIPPQVLAADLVVNLPPRGIRVRSPELWVAGKTNPKNRVKINGHAAAVRPDGTFDELVTLPLGKSTLTVETTDPDENVATIAWPVDVTETEHFLLVLADGAISTARSTGDGGGWTADGAEIDGMGEHTSVAAGHVLLHGRVALYYKGRIKGGDLFKQYKLTAHVDTAKQGEFEEFFQNTLDPTRDYAVYGDAAEEVRDANARGKLYLLVEADESKAMVGNFKTALQGGELFRYDRTVYGAQIDFKKDFGAVKQEVKAFGTTGDGRLARDVNVFRATGGSLYYLRHGRIVEGGERVRVIVRDRDNGLVLTERAMARDADYAIDYVGGRILFKEPIASTADAAFLIDNLDSSVTPLDGHPVYVEVTYEYQLDEHEGGMAGGVYVRDTLFDTLAIGAGIVGEQRDDTGALDDYRLMGADLTWKPRKRTTIHAEIAESESSDAGNWISQDGGLTFQGLNAVGEFTDDANRGGRTAWKLELDTTLGDFAKHELLEGMRVRLYGQKLDRGFFSGGTILEQGRTKYGGQLTFRPAEQHQITLRHDAEIALVPRVGPTPEAVAANDDPLRLDERASYLTSLAYLYTSKRADLKLEVARQGLSSTAALADRETAALDTIRYGVGGMISYKFARWGTARLGQEVTWLDGGVTLDPVLSPIMHGPEGKDYDNRLAGVATTVGLDLKLAKDVTLSTTGAVRWNGDTAAQIGLKTPVGENGSMYVSERFEDRAGRLVSTSVVGGEERFGGGAGGKGGKAYGEYQLETGVSGTRNRAVLGLGHKWSLFPGWNIAAGFEHQQTFGGYLPDGTPIGAAQRDVVHLGTEFTRLRKVKASAQVEVRFDDGFHDAGPFTSNAVQPKYEQLIKDDPRGVTPAGTYPDHGGTAPGAPLVVPSGERVQIVAGAAADWRWTRDQTFLVRFRISHTEDITNANHELPEGGSLPPGVPETFTVARHVEATAGWAYRPLEIDWLDILLKYTWLLDMRPLGLDGQSIVSESHVASLQPMIDLPYDLQLSGKLAWKRTMSEAELIEDQELSATVDSFLVLARLGWKFYGRWDVAGEYRFLRLEKPLGGESKHGFLVELDYNVTRLVRLGVGYNFSHFSDDELGDLERDTHGFFFRVVGRY